MRRDWPEESWRVASPGSTLVQTRGGLRPGSSDSSGDPRANVEWTPADGLPSEMNGHCDKRISSQLTHGSAT